VSDWKVHSAELPCGCCVRANLILSGETTPEQALVHYGAMVAFSSGHDFSHVAICREADTYEEKATFWLDSVGDSRELPDFWRPNGCPEC
jgi:hypothetical protein